MTNSIKRICVLLICVVLLSQSVGCSRDEKANGGEGITKYGTVWSAPSTTKIQRSATDYANKGPAELSYNAVKNEYESQQLLISASQDITSYDLTISDLTCGDNVLSKDNIDVYNERYVKYSEASYGSYDLPDALIPLDAAREYDELNVKKGNNAALWITIYIPTSTPAGTYKGTFELAIEEETMDIPVEVCVNEYVLPDTISAKTDFSWSYSASGIGELDNSMEMMNYYYDFFLDYRVCLQDLPKETNSGEETVAMLEKYYDKISAYAIDALAGDKDNDMRNHMQEAKEQILAIAEISTKEKNYLDKAYIYYIDEPNLWKDEEFTNCINNYKAMVVTLDECVQIIKDDKTGAYDNFKQIQDWEKVITNIPNLMPLQDAAVQTVVKEYKNNTERGQEFLSMISALCPAIESLNDDTLEALYEICDKYDLALWWYSAWLPLAPAPNFHIADDSLLRARSFFWIQKELNVEGNLYWEAAASCYIGSGQGNCYLNIYETPMRMEGLVAGDGFLVYPGKPYGVYGPIPSVRLMAIRDGLEEYEMLADLEKKYENMRTSYGQQFDASAFMEAFYTDIRYNNYVLRADGEAGLDFDQVRKNLIDGLVWCSNGVNFAIQKGTTYKNQTAITYYVAEGYKVYIEQELQTPVEGCRYEYSLDLEKRQDLELTIEAPDGTQYSYTQYIGEPVNTLQEFSDESALQYVSVNAESTVSLAETNEYSTDGTSAHVKVNGLITGREFVDAEYVPFASISVDAFDGISKLTDVDAIYFDIYNPGADFEFALRLYNGVTYVEVGTIKVKTGANTVDIRMNEIDYAKIDEIDRIAFEFVNSDDGKTAKSYEFYLDNVIGVNEKKGE